MRSQFAWKIRALAAIIIIIACVLGYRLYDLQVVHGADYRRQAEAQYVKQSPNQIDRGSIYFSGKDGTLISAATQAAGYTVALNPSLIKDSAAAYAVLKELLPDVAEGDFMAKAGKTDDTYEEIARKVPNEVGQKINALKIPGVQALRETWRYYPGGDLAPQTVGFLGYGDGGTSLSGQYGLERYYDSELSKSVNGLYVNFFADLFTNIGTELSGHAPEGADLVTTIEPSVQQFLQGELKKYYDEWHPSVEGGIIMDPKTGAIIAMAAYPDFDPNDLKNGSVSQFANPLVESVFEFGSTMKPLTMAAGIDSGAVNATSTYNDKGCAVFDTLKVCNYDHKARGPNTPMQQILSQSLNLGVSYVTTKMGTATFKNYFEKYGITSETGIDLPNEGSPLVSNFQSPRIVEYVTASFGQGIALTPIAMTRALATLANHGMVPSPHVGAELKYGDGVPKVLSFTPQHEAVTPQTAETVTRMLVNVVDDSLAGGTVKLPEYSVAAKTGTAQIVDPAAHAYYSDRYLHSFFGYFPAYDAKFIIFLFAKEPKGAQYASETWTKRFAETVKFLINYYDIPPDRGVQTLNSTTPTHE